MKSKPSLRISALALAFLTPSAGQLSAQAPFSQDFNGVALDPGWTLASPNPSSSSQLTGSALVILASWRNGGSDLWSGSNLNAPRLLQHVDASGDWIIETKFAFAPGNDYQGAGLLLAKTNGVSSNTGDFWRISERAYYPNGGGQVIRSVGDYVGYAGTTSYLRVQKSGTAYTGWWSTDGSSWTLSGSITNTDAWTYLGVFVIRQPWDGASVDSSAAFYYFHATTPLPVITSPTNATAVAGWYFSYTITATGNPTGYNASGLPDGLSLNGATGLISGITTNLGTFPVLLTATNSASGSSATLWLTVTTNSFVQWSPTQGGNGHWYNAILVGPAGITWSNALAAASAAGGHLATITSAAENTFVYNLVTNAQFWWLDGSGNGEGPWLGGFQTAGSPEPGGNWQWITGEPFTYSRWAAGEPNNVDGIEDRLLLHGKATLVGSWWNDFPGDYLQRGYVIEYEPPRLDIQAAPPDEVILFWPAWAASYLLESSPTLPATGGWQTVTNSRVILSNYCFVTNTAAQSASFYRLRY